MPPPSVPPETSPTPPTPPRPGASIHRSSPLCGDLVALDFETEPLDWRGRLGLWLTGPVEVELRCHKEVGHPPGHGGYAPAAGGRRVVVTWQ